MTDERPRYDETSGLFFGNGSLTGLPGRDFSGNKIVRTPKVSGTLGLSYSFELGDGELEIAGDAYYSDGFYYTAQNTDVARQKAYSLINARVSYYHQPWKARITIFGQNLDNETYSFSEFTADFGTNYTLAPPRTYGLRLNWEF